MGGTEWAEKNFYLTSEDTNEVGRFTTERMPWQRFILDALAEGIYRVIVFMSSSQISKTTMIKSDIGRVIDQDPCSILLVQPDKTMAKTFSTDRFTPMIEASPVLRGKIRPARTRDSGNATLYKRFPGGQITFTGAQSPAPLKMRPIRRGYFDEINEYPADVGGQGDPVAIAMKRMTAFESDSLAFLSSTPTDKSRGRIEAWYEKSTRHKCYVPCPECGEMQILSDMQFRYKGVKPEEITSVDYECIRCAYQIPESKKQWMLDRYEWRAENPTSLILGVWIWQAYSMLSSWVSIVREKIEAEKDPELFKVYWNQTLGKSWEEKSNVDWTNIYDRREPYKIGIVPKDCLVLTAFVDVQKDRLEVEVKGWTPDLQCYSVDYFALPGPVDDMQPDGRWPETSIWSRLSLFVNQTYQHESGPRLNIAAIGVDTGYETQTVYNWIRSQDPSRVFACKGHKNFYAPAIGVPKGVDVDFLGMKIQNGVKLWMVGTSQIKSEIYGLLKRRPKVSKDPEGKEFYAYPARYMHFPQYDEEYFRQLTSETIVTEGKTVKKPRWEKISSHIRNEVLDLNVGNRFLSLLLGLERLTPENWEEIRKMVFNINDAPQARKRSAVLSRGVDD